MEIFIIMKKICKTCFEEKDIDDFFKKTMSPDGHQPSCKICTCRLSKEYAIAKKERDKDFPNRKNKWDRSTLTLTGISKGDYCNMYYFLSKIGYNPEMDIHTQFCEKWSLLVSNESRKGDENHYTYEDCKK